MAAYYCCLCIIIAYYYAIGFGAAIPGIIEAATGGCIGVGIPGAIIG